MITILGFGGGVGAVAFAITANAIALLFAALTIMLYLLVPWTSVNLVDYFFVRRGRYAITHLFMPHGIYGAWGGRGLIAYCAGILRDAAVFRAARSVHGPAARALGGRRCRLAGRPDGIGGGYLILSRSFDPAREARAIRDSDRLLLRRG